MVGLSVYILADTFFISVHSGANGLADVYKRQEIAVDTVMKYKEKTHSKIKVLFNVFKEEDKRLYEKILE